MHLDESQTLTQENLHPLFVELRKALNDYLSQKTHRTINSLSKKCKVSEPTLRRIYKGQLKTLPTVTTILDILSTITGKISPAEIAQQFPGPIAEFLKTVSPQIEDCQTEYSAELNSILSQPVNYILYKLCSNSIGLSEKKAEDLFGAHGIAALQKLNLKNLIRKENNVHRTTTRNFTISKSKIIDNIKILAEFIKLRASVTDPLLNPLQANYSESVSVETYKEVVQIQKKALENIRKVMSNDKNGGPIPLFLFAAVDTLDTKTAFEIANDIKS